MRDVEASQSCSKSETVTWTGGLGCWGSMVTGRTRVVGVQSGEVEVVFQLAGTWPETIGVLGVSASSMAGFAGAESRSGSESESESELFQVGGSVEVLVVQLSELVGLAVEGVEVVVQFPEDVRSAPVVTGTTTRLVALVTAEEVPVVQLSDVSGPEVDMVDQVLEAIDAGEGGVAGEEGSGIVTVSVMLMVEVSSQVVVSCAVEVTVVDSVASTVVTDVIVCTSVLTCWMTVVSSWVVVSSKVLTSVSVAVRVIVMFATAVLGSAVEIP